jgi:tetratricopeptide (TPR) repeat protein
MEAVQWGPAFAFVAAGLALGAALLWRLGRKPPAAAPAQPETELERRDLETRLEARLAQLRELEDIGGERGAGQLAQERRALELDAARTLLALEALAAPAAGGAAAALESAPSAAAPEVSPAVSPAPSPAGSSARAGFFWGIGSAAALGLLFYFVFQAAEQRAPGGSVTGSLPPMGESSAAMGSAAGGPTADAELAEITAFVAQNPQDVEARLELARRQLVRQEMMAVFTETQAVLAIDADNPRALSYQSLVRLAMGQADRAEAMLERALQRDPTLFDGYVHLMLVHTSLGNAPAAEAVYARAVAQYPDRADVLRRLLDEMRAVTPVAPPAGATGEDPHAGVESPGAAAPALPAAPAGGSDSVSGILELDPAARAALAPGAVVFVTLRPAGALGGAPLAARRLAATGFPLAFEIGQGDSMTGASIPTSVVLEARLDTDGDLATRPPSDPFVRADGVPLGTRDLRLELRPRDDG